MSSYTRPRLDDVRHPRQIELQERYAAALAEQARQKAARRALEETIPQLRAWLQHRAEGADELQKLSDAGEPDIESECAARVYRAVLAWLDMHA